MRESAKLGQSTTEAPCEIESAWGKRNLRGDAAPGEASRGLESLVGVGESGEEKRAPCSHRASRGCGQFPMDSAQEFPGLLVVGLFGQDAQQQVAAFREPARLHEQRGVFKAPGRLVR